MPAPLQAFARFVKSAFNCLPGVSGGDGRTERRMLNEPAHKFDVSTIEAFAIELWKRLFPEKGELPQDEREWKPKLLAELAKLAVVPKAQHAGLEKLPAFQRAVMSLAEKQGCLRTSDRKKTETPPPPAPDPLLHPYLLHLARECGTVDFPGLPRDPNHALRLVQVYAELHAFDWRKEETEQARYLRETDAATRRIPVLELAGDPDLPRLVLLGPPGGGKSTFLRHLAYCLACQSWQPAGGAIKQADKDAARQAAEDLRRHWGQPAQAGYLGSVPIWIELRKLFEKQPDEFPGPTPKPTSEWLLQRHLELAEQPAATVSALENAVQTGRAIFLLDGLDEITVAEQRQFIQTALQDLKARCGHNRMLLTCRERTWAGDWGIPGWGEERHLAGFDPTARATFLDRWFKAWPALGLASETAAKAKRAQIQQLLAHPDANRGGKLEDMLRVPLLLTMLAWLQTYRLELPRARAALYEEFIQTLLWDLDRHREVKVSLAGLVAQASVTREAFYGALCRVAFEAQCATPKEGLADIGEAVWRKTFAELPPRPDRAAQRPGLTESAAKDWAEKILATMQFRFGLVRDEGAATFRFQHRSFQEYLAAAHLTIAPGGTAAAIRWKGSALAVADPGELSARRESLWEVFRLLAGRLAHVEAKATPRAPRTR